MRSAFDLLHRHVQRKLWDMKWTEIRPIQDEAIRHLLLGGGDAVISSATASGKTEAAFLPVLSAIADTPGGSVRAMYIGPLKALINDQFRRVEELCDRMEMPVCKWHGDVGDGAKQRLLDHPAGVLLITPESLEAMLVRRPAIVPKVFGRLAFVVVDEMHALLGTERGAQLVSQLHRVSKRAGCDPVRVGLSATLGQPELALKWLRPNGPPAVLLADPAAGSALQIRVRGLWARGDEAHPDVRELARSMMVACRDKTNLVFANAKARIEELADALSMEGAEMKLADEVVVHHGSLSRERRLHAEERLRTATCCTAVCSNTLELGIDIGHIDNVVQVSAPWSVASLAQRVGRSGRRGGARVLRGYFVEAAPHDGSEVWDRLHLDFIQGIAIIELLLARFIEPPAVGRRHLSTLVHQCLAFLAETGGTDPAVLFQRIVGSGAFGDVTRDDYKAVLRELGRVDLIEQMRDGTLILGLAGQRIVEHHSFFAAFNAPEELRVIHGSDEIGTVWAPPAPGEHLILAGRRWRVDSIDAERREVLVSPSRGGRKPFFVPSKGTVHAEIHRKMKALLVGTDAPTYLDETALQILASARQEAAKHDGFRRAAEPYEGGVRLFVFGGSKVQQTLLLVLSRAELEVSDEDVGFDVEARPEQVVTALRAFVAKPELLELAQHADRVLQRRELGREKFEMFVAPEVWRRAFVQDELDGRGAVSAARSALVALEAPSRQASQVRCEMGMRVVASRFIEDAHVDRDEAAALGAPVWGPPALLGDLELRLGLPRVQTSDAHRCDAYARRLEAGLAASPFYEGSFHTDRHGTATVLLRWRDELIEAGWRAEELPGAGARIAALVEAERSPGEPIPLGFADRVARVERELRLTRSRTYERVDLLESRDAWPESWRRVFELLSALGTPVEQMSRPVRPAANGSTDLSFSQARLALEADVSAPCSWSGDGSLVHVRAPTSWQLGETVVGLIRAAGIEDTLVIRLGDAAPLEAAFALQGVPGQGHGTSSSLRSPLQVLPLALALMFSPRDPYRALELLTLPHGPFGQYAARVLADAIAEAPGVGSRAWLRAKEQLRSPRDSTDRLHVAAAAKSTSKIEAWFEGPVSDASQGAPLADVLSVIRRVKEWARLRPHEAPRVRWHSLWRAAVDLERWVISHPRERARPHELDQLARRAIGVGMYEDVALERAGRPALVSSPHAVLREHDAIVVWHAGHDPRTGAGHRAAPWRDSEERAFEAAGLRLVDPEQATMSDSAAWRRAFASAKRLFVIATPETHLSAAQAALPLWDEIVARCGAAEPSINRVTLRAEHVLAADGLARDLPTVVAALTELPLPDARDSWAMEMSLLSRAMDRVPRLAPTSLETLLACPLRFVLESVAKIRRSRLASVPEKSLLYGQLGHRLAEELYAAGALGAPEQVQALAGPLLDDLIEREGGPLLVPGMAAEREQVRQGLLDAMQELSRMVVGSGMSVAGVEIETHARFDDHEIAGRIDLLLRGESGREAIVDLKWGESRCRDALAKGLALQLASYAETRRRETGSAAPIEAAYFALRTSRTIALAGSSFRGARTFEADSLEHTWERAERSVRMVFDRIKSGSLLASAGADDEKISFLAHHDLATGDRTRYYDPPASSSCVHCANGTLCGRSWKALR